MSNPNQAPIRVMRVIARMNIGGPAVQVTGLMRGLNAREFDHRLYTGFCTADEADYLESNATNIPVIRIAGFGRRVNLTSDVRAFIALVREIRDFKPHIIHTHTAKAGFLGRIASLVSMQPSIRIHTFHGHLLNGYFGWYKRLLIIMAEKFLATFTHQLLAVGDKVRQDLLTVGIGNPKKFDIMPPGLEIGYLPNKGESQEFYGLSKNTLQCAFIGRVTRIKRPDRFLDIVGEVKKRGINVDFFIAGDGELLEMCREIINRDDLPVIILGWQNNIEKLLAAADMMILTSDNEGTPLSLIQAGMAGLPVVATKVGSVPEIVLDGVTGIITGTGISEIADEIEKLAKDSSLREKLGSAARDFTRANFGVKRLVRDHEELYKHLIASQAKS